MRQVGEAIPHPASEVSREQKNIYNLYITCNVGYVSVAFAAGTAVIVYGIAEWMVKYMELTKQVVIHLTVETHKQLKLRAMTEGISLKALVERAALREIGTVLAAGGTTALIAPVVDTTPRPAPIKCNWSGTVPICTPECVIPCKSKVYVKGGMISWCVKRKECIHGDPDCPAAACGRLLAKQGVEL